jgi:hypothetical protein
MHVGNRAFEGASGALWWMRPAGSMQANGRHLPGLLVTNR